MFDPMSARFRVVVLEERDQGRGDRHELLGRHVHEVDSGRRQQRVVVPLGGTGTSSSAK